VIEHKIYRQPCILFNIFFSSLVFIRTKSHLLLMPYQRASSLLRGADIFCLYHPPFRIEAASGPEDAPDFRDLTPNCALVAPPRLPALRSGFHAPARYKQKPARTGGLGHKRSSNDHSFSCGIVMHDGAISQKENN
jgi:hypothetical protein